MSVELVGIAFDHGAGLPDTRALRIRHDGTTPAQGNVAAYALVPTEGKTLTIEATLHFPDLGSDSLAAGEVVTVRAHATTSSSKVLGNVVETNVTVPASTRQATFVFDLQAPKLHAEGIGKYTVTWDWQFRLTATSPWVTFNTSTATIYVTLDFPAAPWTQSNALPAARRQPWVRLLNLACAWAKGVKLPGKTSKNRTPTAVKNIAKRVEQGVYGLGDSGKLVYISGGDARYCVGISTAAFQMTTFLDDVEGPEEGFEIYCTECAAAVALAVNCLGGDLSLLRLDRPVGPIHLNSYMLIGKTTANQGNFDFHDVAVRTSATSRQVFDATLRVDWDVNVANKVYDYKLTQGRRLGKTEVKPKGTAYLQRLLESGVAAQWTDLMLCNVAVPCIDHCDGPPPPDPCTDQEFQNVRAELGQSAPGAPILFPEPPRILPPKITGFRVVKRIDNPARLAALAPLVSASAEFLYVADGKPANNGRPSKPKVDRRQFKLAVSWSPTPAEALDALAWLMVRTPVHLSEFPGKMKQKVGDLARGSTRDGVVYLLRGNVLAHVARVGESIPPTETIANAMDKAILEHWSAPPPHQPPPDPQKPLLRPRGK